MKEIIMENLINNSFYVKNNIPIISFAFGTLLYILLVMKRVNTLLYIGLIYIFVAFLINTIYSIYLPSISYQNKINLEETATRLRITILNIPITILYIYLVFNVIL
ncbi:MAG: hypothetical protein ACI924_001978 [Flavobacterium sp.]|jgi:hypothetical protein